MGTDNTENLSSRPLVEHLRFRVKILKSLLENSKLLESPHGKGITREFFIKEFLEDHLPQVIKIGRGEIIESTNKSKTGDIDIVLYFSSMPKLTIGDSTLFLAESVAATIEVKTSLAGAHLKEAIDKCSAVLKIEREQVTNRTGFVISKEHFDRFFKRVRTYIFAYESGDLNTLSGKLNSTEAPDFICSLSQGCVIKKK